MATAVRRADVVVSDPVVVPAGSPGPYPAGTVLATFTYDDGDRFLSVAPGWAIALLEMPLRPEDAEVHYSAG